MRERGRLRDCGVEGKDPGDETEVDVEVVLQIVRIQPQGSRRIEMSVGCT